MHAATRWNAPTAAVYRPHAANPVTIEQSAQRAIDASAGRTASSPDRHASADGYIGRTAAFLDGDHPSGEDGVLGATMSDGSDALGNSFGAHAGARRAPRRAAPAAPVTALPIWLTGILFVLVLPGLAILVQLAIRRRWPVLADGEHNDVAGFIIAVVGVIYAGLLAFVVIVSWENFSQAESTVGQEASALRSIYRESQAFPPDVRARIRPTC